MPHGKKYVDARGSIDCPHGHQIAVERDGR